MKKISNFSKKASAAAQYGESGEYWLNKFSGNLGKTSFPYTYLKSPPAQAQEKKDPVKFPLKGELASKLMELSKGLDHRIYIILAACLVGLLHKYTGNKDIIFISPIFKQDKECDFINTVLPLRYRLKSDMTFRELLLNCVRHTIVEAGEHQNYPIESLLLRLNIPLSENKFPLSDIALLLENIHERKYIKPIIPNMLFSFLRINCRIKGEVNYNPTLYDEKTVERIVRHFERFMQEAFIDINTPLSRIDILGEEEKKQLLVNFNNTRTSYPAEKTIIELFEEQVSRTPDKIAVSFPLDVSDIYEELKFNHINAGMLNKLGSCCFKKRIHIFQSNLEIPGNPDYKVTYKILKTDQHNSVVVNNNLLKLIDLFDGNHSLDSIFNWLKGFKNSLLKFAVYAVISGDILEIYFDFDSRPRIFSIDGFEDLVGLVKSLYMNNLIELFGLNPNTPGIEIPVRKYFEEDESLPGGILQEDLLNQNKKLLKAHVLLLGDTPGMPTSGLLYLASFLKRNGIKAYCLFADSSKDNQSMKENIEALLEEIQPKIVAISLKWFMYISRVISICKIVKEYSLKNNLDIKVIVGGNTASYYWKEILRFDPVDYVIRGDGEEPLLKICRGEENIPNCSYKKNGKIIENPMSYIQDETNSKEIYLSHLDEILISKNASIFGTFFIYTHKGCGMNCLYCGGCKQAQQRVFNRTKVFRRGKEEVRKDIIEAKKYTSTFMFDFYASNEVLLDYCKKIWGGIDLSSHFCIFRNMALPSGELIKLLKETFAYVYLEIDVCTLSQRHRDRLTSLGVMKPLPTDEQMLDLLNKCEKYHNLEVRMNLITGLPYLIPGDITQGKKLLTKMVSTYSCFGELHLARIHAQPGAPIVENAQLYDMHSFASTFEDYFKYSEKNFQGNSNYTSLESLNYPYIYFNDEELNSKVTRFYAECNLEIEKYQEKKRTGLLLSKNFTFNELNRDANQLARLLKRKGIKSDSQVGILLEPSSEIPLAILGVLKTGGSYLPIDAEFPGKRIHSMLKDSHLSILLSKNHLGNEHLLKPARALQVNNREIDFIPGRKKIPKEDDFEIIMLDEHIEWSSKEHGEKLETMNNPAGIVYNCFTSGSSGKPKGVLVKNENLVNYVNWFSQAARLTVEDKTVLTSSFAFDLGYTALYTSILNGGELHIIPKEMYLDPEILLNYIEQKGITYLKITPSLLSVIVNSSDYSMAKCKKLRLIVSGGEEINITDIKSIHSIRSDIEIINHYGPTEAAIGAIATSIDFDKFEEYKRNPVIGKPINNTRVFILDKNSNLLPIGVPGELCISGTCLARGYLNRPELTAERFVFGFYKSYRSQMFDISYKSYIYKTGDLARWLPDGNIEFMGRVDNQVKIRGYRVELGEIENQLLKHNRVKEAVVIERKNDEGEKYLCAYIVLEKEKNETGKDKEIIKPKKIEKVEDINQSIVNCFEKQVKKFHNQRAIGATNKFWTFDTLNNFANQIAHLILEKYDNRYSLSADERTRYRRQMLLNGWGIESQEKLKSTTVFVAGAGGGGSAAIMQLALCGIGTIIVCDNDIVELSNLNRQFLHDQSKIGMNKALSTQLTINQINPHVNVIAITEKLTRENVSELVGDSAVIFDMFDDQAYKFILSACAAIKEIPHITAAMIDISSYAVIFQPPKTPCFHCLFNKNKLEELVSGMKSTVKEYEKKPLAVASPSLFVSTGFAVNEAIKIILGINNPAYNKYFLFNQHGTENIGNSDSFRAMTYTFSDHFKRICQEQGFDWEIGWRGNYLEELKITPDPLCPLCGKKGKEKLLALKNHLKRKTTAANITSTPAAREKEIIKESQPGKKLQTAALLIDDREFQAASIIGILKAGKICVPLDTNHTEKQLCDVLEKSGARIILTDNNNHMLAEKLKIKVNKRIHIINVRKPKGDGEIKVGNLRLKIEPGDIAFIWYAPDQGKIRDAVMQSHKEVLGLLRPEPSAITPNSKISDSTVTLLDTLLNRNTSSSFTLGKKNEFFSMSQLSNYLLNELPGYMIPSHFLQVEELPLTPNGKIDKNALPQPDSRRDKNESIPPGNEIEEKLAGIWSGVLGIEKSRISMDDNFFELGGHSLKVTRLVYILQNDMNIKLPLSEIFKNQTIKALGKFIKSMETSRGILVEKDENLVPLEIKKGISNVNNLFLIHAGSGEVEGYLELCQHLNPGFNYWGIRANRLKDYTPINLAVEDTAKIYIQKIKKVQPTGPYYLAGWCVGGIIGYEMVRQLEHMNEEIGFFAMINSSALHQDNPGSTWQDKFTLESELNLIREYFDKGIIDRVKNQTEINQIWPAVVEYLEKNNYQIEIIKKAIPATFARAMPNYEELNIEQLIYYLNTIRTFYNTYSFYVPRNKINSPILYFKTSHSPDQNGKFWNEYAAGPINLIEITGDHFSIFRKPHVVEFAKKLDSVIN